MGGIVNTMLLQEDRILGKIRSVRNILDDPTISLPTPSVPGPLLEASYTSLSDLKKMFESKLIPPHCKKKWVKVLQDIRLKTRKGATVDGIAILLDVLETLKDYENIVLEATSVITNLLKYPEGAADVDRQRGKHILQICLKRWAKDEFIPLEVEYGLKQLKAQQGAIRDLSQVALKKAIKATDLSAVVTMMESNSQNRNVCVPCLVGILRIVTDHKDKLNDLRSNEHWLQLIIKVLDEHNRSEELLSSGATLLNMISEESNGVRRKIAKEGGMGVAVRSIFVYAENKTVLQQLFWLLNELILDRHNIRDFLVLKGEKAMHFFEESQRKSKEPINILVPARLRRLCEAVPRIRSELETTGRFEFDMENFSGAFNGIETRGSA